MTEESSADADETEHDDGAEHVEGEEHEEGRDGAEDEPPADELAPARSDEEPDVEAAKAELEAVGATEDDEPEAETDAETADDVADADSDEAHGDDANEDGPEADTNADAEADDESTPEATVDADDGADVEEDDGADTDVDDEPNPEDLVRDPDEPQVTSSLDAAAEEAEGETAGEPGMADEPETADGTEGADDTDTGPDAVTDAAGGSIDAASADADQPTDETDGVDSPTDSAESSGADAEAAASADESTAEASGNGHQPGVPEDVQKYDRFKKVDGSQYERVNEFLRDRTYITAREWAIARLCSDFRTETGVEMTKIGNNLPELVPFMTDTYTPQAVNQARASFEDKVRTAGATFLYGAMCDFFTAEELDDVMYEATEVAKFLLEVEGVELSVEDELEAEDRISAVMREVRSSSAELRHERCPDCGAELSGGD